MASIHVQLGLKKAFALPHIDRAFQFGRVGFFQGGAGQSLVHRGVDTQTHPIALGNVSGTRVVFVDFDEQIQSLPPYN